MRQVRRAQDQLLQKCLAQQIIDRYDAARARPLGALEAARLDALAPRIEIARRLAS
jgi:hypothetical protein